MKFANDSGFLDKVSEFIEVKNNATSKKCIQELHKIILDAYQASEKIQYDIILHHSNIPFPTEISSFYFPIHIQKLIKETGKRYYELTFQVGVRRITIYFVLFGKFDVHKYIRNIIMWFTLVNNISDVECSQTLTVYLYLTREKKEFPDNNEDIIGPEHVNSAYTYVCKPQGEMVIFREEEWFKVLLHESMHSFGLDFGRMDDRELQEKILQLFPVSLTNLQLSETYTELWAEIMNVAFIAFDYLDENRENNKLFTLFMEFLLSMEVLFSVIQTKKILLKMNLTYEKLKDPEHSKKFKQETHIFEYFVLKTMLLFNYPKFLCWVFETNRYIIPFTKDDRIQNSYFLLFKNESSNPNFLDTMKYACINDDSTTLRMSVCEL